MDYIERKRVGETGRIPTLTILGQTNVPFISIENVKNAIIDPDTDEDLITCDESVGMNLYNYEYSEKHLVTEVPETEDTKTKEAPEIKEVPETEDPQEKKFTKQKFRKQKKLLK